MKRYTALLIVGATVVFLLIVRLRLADVPLERDEGEYAYSGQLILQGIPPYQLAYNMKFPGTYYAYSLIESIFGQTSWGIHAGLAVVNAITIFLVYFLSLRVLGDAMAATISAIAFGVLSVDRWVMGVFGHATHFVVLAAVAGLLVLFRALDSRRDLTFAIAGALFGLSVLMKQNGIFFLALGIGITVWKATRKQWAWFAAGASAPLFLVVAVLFAQGVLGRFWYWTFQYAGEYVSEVSPGDAWGIFARMVVRVTQADMVIWILAIVGVGLLWIDEWPKETRTFLAALLFTSLIAISPGFYFREHYFIMLLPSMALSCGVAVLSIARLSRKLTSTKIARFIAAGIFVIVTGTYIGSQSHYLFAMTPQELSRSVYGANPFVESPEIGRYIREHTNSDDRIAVLGSEPQIYFYAHRKSATGYIYTYELMEEQKFSRRMQDEMISQITATHPKYVLFVQISASWFARNPMEKILTWSEAYLTKCYGRVGLAEIDPDTTRWFWDGDIARYQPASPFVLFLFRANADPKCSVPA